MSDDTGDIISYEDARDRVGRELFGAEWDITLSDDEWSEYAFLETMKDLRLPGRPDRPVMVLSARFRRDRGAASDGERIRFTSAILPLWARRTKHSDALPPMLDLLGISTGEFQGR